MDEKIIDIFIYLLLIIVGIIIGYYICKKISPSKLLGGYTLGKTIFGGWDCPECKTINDNKIIKCINCGTQKQQPDNKLKHHLSKSPDDLLGNISEFLDYTLKLNDWKNNKMKSLFTLNIDGDIELKDFYEWVNTADPDDIDKLKKIEFIEIKELDGKILAKLKNLENLKMTYNDKNNLYVQGRISNTKYLSELSNLKVLKLNFVLLENYDFLAYLQELETLLMGTYYNYSHMPKIPIKTQEERQIKALETLGTLPKLKKVMLRNQPYDLSPLSNCTQIEELVLNNSDIKSLEPLKSLYNLKKLDIYGAYINDLSPLEKMQNLTTLILTFDEIVNKEQITNLRSTNNNLRIIDKKL